MDAGDFDKLYAASLPRLVGALYAMTGDLPQAQAVVQEAFILAWDRRARLGTNPEVWVRMTAWRLATSRWRRARSAIAGEAPARGSAIGLPDLPDRELAAALRRLSQAQRHAIILFYLCDRSVDQIATETGAQVGTVTARLSHGRAALAKSLTGDLTEQAISARNRPGADLDDRLDHAVRSTLQTLSDHAANAELPSAAAQLRALGRQRRQWRIGASAGLTGLAAISVVIIALIGSSGALSNPPPVKPTAQATVGTIAAVGETAVDSANDVGYLIAAQVVGGRLVVTFDRASWPTTLEATTNPKTTQANGRVEPPQGQQVVNNNPRLRTFTVDETARLLGRVQLGGHGSADSTLISRQQLIDRTAALVGLYGHGPLVNLTHRLGAEGPVSRLEELSNP